MSHRVGKVDPDGVKPRPIIARINNYAIRHELIKKSRDLRETEDMAEVSVNQELTKYRAKLAYECRKLVRLKKLKLTFIWDGKFFVIDKKENKRQIRSVDDLIELYNTLGVPLNVASDGWTFRTRVNVYQHTESLWLVVTVERTAQQLSRVWPDPRQLGQLFVALVILQHCLYENLPCC